MRRLITLISAGRNRIVMIRRELPRTKGAGWAQRPYRPERWRILLSVRPRPITCTVALQHGVSSKIESAQTKPAIPSSLGMGFSHRCQDPSRPSGSERQRAAASRRAAWTGGADATRSNWREWQAWVALRCFSFRFTLHFGTDCDRPDKAQQLAADRGDDLRFFLAGVQ